MEIGKIISGDDWELTVPGRIDGAAANQLELEVLAAIKHGAKVLYVNLAHATFLYDDLTVVENVRFWARAAGGSVAEADAAIARLEIDPRLRDVPVVRLSTGQRRRTSLAVLVARRPRLWLLDEPHAGLDQGGRDIVDELVRDAVAVGATVLVASHELDRTRTIASRVITIAGGVVVDDRANAVPARNGDLDVA